MHPSLQIDPEWEPPERSLNATNEGHRRFFAKYPTDELEGRPDLISRDAPRVGERELVPVFTGAYLRPPAAHLHGGPVLNRQGRCLCLATGKHAPATPHSELPVGEASHPAQSLFIDSPLVGPWSTPVAKSDVYIPHELSHRASSVRTAPAWCRT